MQQTKVFFSSVFGVILFISSTIIAGYLYPNYSHVSQLISESYAVDAPHDIALRFLGFIPSGFFFVCFSFYAYPVFPKSKLTTLGFKCFGIAYGIGTIVCSIFNCDAGCNPEFINPSLSQLIHNLTGMLTYLIVPIAIVLIGFGTKKWNILRTYSSGSIIIGVICFSLVLYFNANLEATHKGLTQRLIEGLILTWILFTAGHIKKSYQQIQNLKSKI